MIAMPAHPALTTPQALAVVGPSGNELMVLQVLQYKMHHVYFLRSKLVQPGRSRKFPVSDSYYTKST